MKAFLDDKATVPFFSQRSVFLSQVMELKGFSWLLVGMVTCASADFFVSKPQLVLVDVTELGTIKIKLEIAWKYGCTHTCDI